MLAVRIVMLLFVAAFVVAYVRSTLRYKKWSIRRRVMRQYGASEMLEPIIIGNYPDFAAFQRGGTWVVTIDSASTVVPPWVQMIRDQLKERTGPTQLGQFATGDARDEEVNLWERAADTTDAAAEAVKILNKRFPVGAVSV